MKVNVLSSSRFFSQLIAVLLVILIQCPALALALDVRYISYSGPVQFLAPTPTKEPAPSSPEALVVFTNATSFTVADRLAASPPGVASLYPSPIAVSGLSGTITDVNVTISQLTVGRPRDLEFLLVSPTGQTLVFISDVGGTAGCGVTNINLTLDESAASALPNHDVTGCPPAIPITSGTYRPTNYASGSAGDTDAFPAPAPATTHNDSPPEGAATMDSVFDGLNPNGTWNLYVVDDSLGNTGTTTIGGGWSIDITTAGGVAATTTIISSNINPSTIGQNVTFTATTTISSSGLPVTTGTTSFTQQGIAIAGCSNLAVNASGQAQCTTAALGEGSRTIAANYSGTATLGVSSASMTQVINSPTVVTGAQFCNNGGLSFPDPGTPAPVYPSNIVVSNMFGTIATVTSSINGFTAPRPSNMDFLLVSPGNVAFEMMSDAGDAVTPASNLNFVISDAAGGLFGTGALSSGTFRPTDGDTLNTDPFPAPAPAVHSEPAPTGTATFTSVYAGANPNGTWSLFAQDDGVGGGVSSISGWCVTFTLTPFPTTTSVSSSADPSVFGQPVTFTATVGSALGGTPTVGNIQFFDGATPIGGPVAVNASGQAQITTSSLSVGSHTITAQYAGATVGSGGGGFAISTGSLTTNPQTVNQANTTTSVASSMNPSSTGQPITFTVTVSPVAPGAGTRTGTVDVMRDGQVICNDVALNGSGQATCNMTFTVGFTYAITATYSGDANFLGSNNNASPLQQVVAGPTAANASVSGRVLAPNGLGVSGARVSMQDQQGNVTWAITNPFGFYRFANVPSGQNYFVSVGHKRYQFQSRTIQVGDDLVDVDFVAEGELLSDSSAQRPRRSGPKR